MLRYNSIIKESRFLKILTESLICFVSLILRIKKSSAETQKEIVILCFHKLGDTVFTIPSIEKILDIKKNEIILFCYDHSVPIYKIAFGNSIKYFSFKSEDFIWGGRLAKTHIRKTLKEINPEVILDLTGSMESISTFIFSLAPKIAGINKEIYRKLYTDFIPIKNFTHTTEIYANVVRSFLKNDFSVELKNYENRLNINGPIIIHPFAGWPAKEWGLKNFLDLANLLNNIRDVKLLTPPDSLSDELKREIKSSGIEITETDSIEKLINTVREAYIVIANDTGVIYISNLLGIPTFTIYGPTNPLFHQSGNIRSDYVQKQLPCSPNPDEKLCYTDGGREGCPAYECMRRLDVQSVHSKILNLIQDVYSNSEISG